jgi:uncharacterized membrane protein (UPF0127 family)
MKLYERYFKESLECKTITITNIDNKLVPLNVEIAKTEAEQNQGLMNRYFLAEDWGMLFEYDKEEYRSFWMRNTPLPLSLAYINTEGEIVQLYSMSNSDGKKTYPSEDKVMYALEVNDGWFERFNIGVGCVVKI